MNKQPIVPTVTLLQGKSYTPSERTNIQDTWREFGWTPGRTATKQSRTNMFIYKSKGS